MIRIDVESFKQCFKEKEGVVINTFHGVKGEEYTTVIAFGLLYGYVPHWNIINNKPLRYQTDEKKNCCMWFAHVLKKISIFFRNRGVLRKRDGNFRLQKKLNQLHICMMI